MQEGTEDEIMGKAIEHVMKEHIYIYIHIYIKADSMSPEFREN
jgi:hypothetical protein